LQNTASPIPLLRHSPTIGLPIYWWEAVGQHDPPYSREEELKVVEVKKKDPPSADEVHPRIFVGNKAAAESVPFLTSLGITHVLNLASDQQRIFFVAPDKAGLEAAGIQLKEMGLHDREEAEVSTSFRTAGMWIRSSLASSPEARVLVNCWQGASRSATIVLAFLLQHEAMSLQDALKQIKSRRDVRPNNGFLKQLLRLEKILNKGVNGDLVMLQSEEGKALQKLAEKEATSLLPTMLEHFGKQIGGSLCGVRTSCIVLNCLGIRTENNEMYTEEGFWRTTAAKEVEEEVVKRQGMTLVQCSSILKATGAKVQAWRADESSCDHFKEVVKEASSGGGAKQLVLNYHMGALGQGDVGGHLSPLGGKAGDRALVMDVWPQTRECWAPVERLWSSIDTIDPTNGLKRGFILVSKA